MTQPRNQSPKIYQIEGKSYQFDPKTRGAFNVANPDDKLSRRKLETSLGVLSKQGFKSYEEKARVRKEQGITSDVKSKVVYGGKVNYLKRVENLPEVYQFLRTLKPSQIAFIKMRAMFKSETKVNGRKLLQWFSLTSYSRPSLLLQQSEIIRVQDRVEYLQEIGVNPVYYVIQFTNLETKK